MHPFSPRFLRCPPEARAPWAILMGDPARLEVLLGFLENPRLIGQEREFALVAGYYCGERILGISTGLGAPATAIALEELRHFGVQAAVRAGTMLALHADLGDFILAWGAVRMEGTSTTYLPLSFPAMADPDLFYSLRSVLSESGVPHRIGLVATSDGFYSVLSLPPGSQPDHEKPLQLLYRHGVIGADMETSALYITGMALGIRCASLCLATVGGLDGRTLEDEQRRQKEGSLIQLTLDGIVRFARRQGEGRGR